MNIQWVLKVYIIENSQNSGLIHSLTPGVNFHSGQESVRVIELIIYGVSQGSGVIEKSKLGVSQELGVKNDSQFLTFDSRD